MDITTKHTKEENMFLRIRCPLRYPVFVSFATFVVRKSFVEWRIRDKRPPEKFAQGARTFKTSSFWISDLNVSFVSDFDIRISNF
jgi:hypothetical protein